MENTAVFVIVKALNSYGKFHGFFFMNLCIQNSKTSVLCITTETFIRFGKRNAAEEEYGSCGIQCEHTAGRSVPAYLEYTE